MGRRSRINHRTTSVEEAAVILADRHGQGAQRVASNRGDDAAGEECSMFWEQVHHHLRMRGHDWDRGA